MLVCFCWLIRPARGEDHSFGPGQSAHTRRREPVCSMVSPQARRILAKIALHDTPQHGSGLNMAEATKRHAQNAHLHWTFTLPEVGHPPRDLTGAHFLQNLPGWLNGILSSVLLCTGWTEGLITLQLGSTASTRTSRRYGRNLCRALTQQRGVLLSCRIQWRAGIKSI